MYMYYFILHGCTLIGSLYVVLWDLSSMSHVLFRYLLLDP